MEKYIPSKGDIIILTFDPQAGHEQKGRRPAVVISNQLFNKHTGMAVVCPVTNTKRNNPFHVAVPESEKITGYIMTEQLKSVDYEIRKAKFIEKLPDAKLEEILALIEAIIYQG